MPLQRIKVHAEAPSGILILHDKTGEVLGEFVPGLGYWVTDVNVKSINLLLQSGYASYDDPANAPQLPADLRASEGQLAGFLKVGD